MRCGAASCRGRSCRERSSRCSLEKFWTVKCHFLNLPSQACFPTLHLHKHTRIDLTSLHNGALSLTVVACHRHGISARSGTARWSLRQASTDDLRAFYAPSRPSSRPNRPTATPDKPVRRELAAPTCYPPELPPFGHAPQSRRELPVRERAEHVKTSAFLPLSRPPAVPARPNQSTASS